MGHRLSPQYCRQGFLVPHDRSSHLWHVIEDTMTSILTALLKGYSETAEWLTQVGDLPLILLHGRLILSLEVICIITQIIVYSIL